MNLSPITEKLLSLISDVKLGFSGAYNIRENSGCAARHSTENIAIESKADGSGIDIIVKDGTVGETVYIPASVTQSDVNDLVYNDFQIGENCDITIIAGCGVHTDHEGGSSHDGIHRFYVSKNSKVLYLENHVGTGTGTGKRVINPVTHVELSEGAAMTMDTTQIEGVDSTNRLTTATLGANSNFIVKEKLMTDQDQTAVTSFTVNLDGDGSGTHIVSRSVAKGTSKQTFDMKIFGNAACHGHSECDAIIMENGVVTATPEVTANHIDATLIHEAAIGKIAGDQITKLLTLGLTESEAEEQIIKGFLT